MIQQNAQAVEQEINVSKNNFNLTVSNNAFKKLTEVFKNKPSNTVFKLSITSGGCSGFLTTFLLQDNYNKNEDLLLTLNNNIKIVIHNEIASMIGSAYLHYKSTVLNSYFILDVSIAKDKCSCGSSFSL